MINVIKKYLKGYNLTLKKFGQPVSHLHENKYINGLLFRSGIKTDHGRLNKNAII